MKPQPIKFTFGKYKDVDIKEVLEDDPGYIVWAYENMDCNFVIKEALKKIYLKAVRLKQEEEDFEACQEESFEDAVWGRH